jgi:ClpP class serine protease
MGFLTEYIAKLMTFDQTTAERKAQLSALSVARGGRDILVYAADLMKQGPPIGIDYSDLQPIADQLANLHGKAIDVILETPGGSGEVAEDIVRMLHDNYEQTPGWAEPIARRPRRRAKLAKNSPRAFRATLLVPNSVDSRVC